MREVLVSGAGIAGLTVAYWLAKNGWKVTVIEKAKTERTEGYMMDFYGEGWDVAEKMRITDEIKSIHYPIKDVAVVNREGKPYFTFPVSCMIKSLNNKYRPIRRPDLEHIILQKVEKLNVHVHYGTVVAELMQEEKSVKVKFSNGKKKTFDLVVGADGVHSNIRKLAFGDESEFSHYLGYILSFFHTKRDRSIGDKLCLYQEPNRQFGMYPYSDDEMDVLYILRSPERKRMDQSEYKSFLLKEVKSMGWKAEEILSKTPEEHITLLDTTEQIRMKKLYKNRVVLVGDAGACPTLAAGQGASMAMVESYVLSEKLKEYEDIDEALQAYQNALEDFILQTQIQAEKFAKNFVPDTQLGVTIQRWVFRIAMSPLFSKIALESFSKRKVL